MNLAPLSHVPSGLRALSRASTPRLIDSRTRSSVTYAPLTSSARTGGVMVARAAARSRVGTNKARSGIMRGSEVRGYRSNGGYGTRVPQDGRKPRLSAAEAAHPEKSFKHLFNGGAMPHDTLTLVDANPRSGDDGRNG